MKKFLSILSIILVIVASTNLVMADSFKTVSIGADITDTQKQQMYSAFGVNASDVQTVIITNSIFNRSKLVALKEPYMIQELLRKFVEKTRTSTI